MEVATSAGNIDLLLPGAIIEVKTAKNWKHAMGQLQAYSAWRPGRRLIAYLFGDARSIYESFDIIQEGLTRMGIECWFHESRATLLRLRDSLKGCVAKPETDPLVIGLSPANLERIREADARCVIVEPFASAVNDVKVLKTIGENLSLSVAAQNKLIAYLANLDPVGAGRMVEAIEYSSETLHTVGEQIERCIDAIGIARAFTMECLDMDVPRGATMSRSELRDAFSKWCNLHPHLVKARGRHSGFDRVMEYLHLLGVTEMSGRSRTYHGVALRRST